MRSHRQTLISDSNSAVMLCNRAIRCVVVLLALINATEICNAQSATQDEYASQIGITGHYRIGQWTAVRVDKGEGCEFEIETMDGDGVRVTYQHPPSSSDFEYVVPGIEAAPLVIHKAEESVFSGRFPEIGSPSRGPSAVPVDMAWIVCLGDPMGVDKIGANELLRRDALIAVSKPSDPSMLPDSAMGYDSYLLLRGASARSFIEVQI